MKENPTPSMQLYIEADKRFKEVEAEKKRLRVDVLKDFEANPDVLFKAISCSVSSKVTLDDDLFFEWVAENWPHYLDRLRADKIDYDKFEKLVATEEITYEEIPSHVYKITEIQTIRVGK